MFFYGLSGVIFFTSIKIKHKKCIFFINVLLKRKQLIFHGSLFTADHHSEKKLNKNSVNKKKKLKIVNY